MPVMLILAVPPDMFAAVRLVREAPGPENDPAVAVPVTDRAETVMLDAAGKVIEVPEGSAIKGEFPSVVPAVNFGI